MDGNKKIWIGRTYSTYRGKKGAYRCVVGIPEGRIPFGNLRVNGRIIIKMDLQEVGEG